MTQEYRILLTSFIETLEQLQNEVAQSAGARTGKEATKYDKQSAKTTDKLIEMYKEQLIQ